jgi:CheY-like chemotaxis protein
VTDTSVRTPLRVLVVDDCKDTRDSLAMLLHAWGHEVRLAPDAPSALAACLEFHPDAAVLDIGLPGVSGWDLAAQLREAAGTGPLLLVAVTGWARDEDRSRSQAAGFDAHFAKPPDPEALRRLLAGASTPSPAGAA